MNLVIVIINKVFFCFLCLQNLNEKDFNQGSDDEWAKSYNMGHETVMPCAFTRSNLNYQQLRSKCNRVGIQKTSNANS